jgi:hypothetical protein
MNIPLLLLIFSILLSPVYLWPSGLPQLSHVLALIPAASFCLRGTALKLSPSQYGLLFALYALTVNIIVFVFHRDPKSLYSAAYYIFNWAVWCAVVAAAVSTPGHRFLRGVRLALWAGLLVQLLVILTGVWGKFKAQRPTGTFNDPNQLSHWVVWAVAFLMAEAWLLRRRLTDGALALMLGGTLVFLSGSRSGAMGMMVALIAYVLLVISSIRGEKVMFRLYGAAAGAVVLAILGLLWSEPLRAAVVEYSQNAVERLLATDVTFELEARGYDRLYKFPEWILTGSGEGAEWRWFMKCWFTGEIHSTPANLLFAYGIPGTILFGLFWFLQWRSLPGVAIKLLALAPFAYSIGTYSLRNWSVWIGMALLYGLSLRVRGGAVLEPPAAAPRRGLAKPARAWRPGRPAAHASSKPR